jgi:ABC-type dipeptide/oligopeptide/nickel transport system permease component
VIWRCAIPGVGRLVLGPSGARLSMSGRRLFLALNVAVVMLATDFLIAYVDPRIRFD